MTDRKYASDLDAAVLELLQDGAPRSRAEVAALMPHEPREAVGRALQRLHREGRVTSQGYRASTRYSVDWHRFGLVERHPILQEVPTEFFEGEWHFPKADGPEPWAVITYTHEPSPETGHVGWCWWAMGSMGEASTYEAACEAAIRHLHIF